MEFFKAYMLFAITTGFAAVYELLQPVIAKQEAEAGEVENKTLIYIVFFLIFVLTAPVGFLSCVIPSWGIVFRETLQKALFAQE